MFKVRQTRRLPSINLLMLCSEIGFILLCSLFFTMHLQDWSPKLRFGGADFSLLTDSAAFASNIFHKTGAIPLWDPFVGNGEPMLESTQSFILNPLMSLPILIFGAVQGGKVGVLLHLAIMGLGGWALGRAFGFRSGGRLLTGALLAGSGSMTAALGRGLYELGLSQAYIPWVMAGLWGTLYLRKRFYVGLLALASVLLITAGTFWYVLPTIISAVIIVLFGIFFQTTNEYGRKQIALDIHAVQRLFIAALLTVGIGATRLLTINRVQLFHPQSSEGIAVGFFDMLATYFAPITPRPQQSDWWQNFHYVAPLLFVLPVVVLWLILFLRTKPLAAGRWRLIMPGLLIIVIFTAWSEGQVPLVIWLQTNIPLLADWRNTGRIAAAASPWVIVLCALCFDDILTLLWQLAARPASGTLLSASTLPTALPEIPQGIPRWFSAPRVSPLRWILSFVLAIGMFISIVQIMDNWSRHPYLSSVDGDDNAALGEKDGLLTIRADHPNEMLMVQNQAWLIHYYFADTLARHAFGDADVFTTGVASTLGPDSTMRFWPTYAVGVNGDFTNWARDHGYVAVSDAPKLYNQYSAWYNPTVPAYAFLVNRPLLVQRDWHPLTASETQAVTYFHRINSIALVVNDYSPDSVAVINETAYPGWTVTIDGKAATVESVAGRLGVLLPDKVPDGAPLSIVFSYRPVKLYVGGVITMLSALLFILYILRIDAYVPPQLIRALGWTAGRVAVLMTTTIVSEDPEPPHRQPPKELPPSAPPLLLPPPAPPIIEEEPASEAVQEISAVSLVSVEPSNNKLMLSKFLSTRINPLLETVLRMPLIRLLRAYAWAIVPLIVVTTVQINAHLRYNTLYGYDMGQHLYNTYVVFETGTMPPPPIASNNYQAFQAPLFYVLMALFIKLCGPWNFQGYYVAMALFLVTTGWLLLTINREQHIMRRVPGILRALTVCVVMLFPTNVEMGSMFSNDLLVNVFMFLGLTLLWYMVRRGGILQRRLWLRAAAVIGLAVAFKSNGVIMLGVVLALAAYAALVYFLKHQPVLARRVIGMSALSVPLVLLPMAVNLWHTSHYISDGLLGITLPEHVYIPPMPLSFLTTLDLSIFSNPFSYGPGEGSYWSMQYITLHNDYYNHWSSTAYNTYPRSIMYTPNHRSPFPLTHYADAKLIVWLGIPITAVMLFGFFYSLYRVIFRRRFALRDGSLLIVLVTLASEGAQIQRYMSFAVVRAVVVHARYSAFLYVALFVVGVTCLWKCFGYRKIAGLVLFAGLIVVMSAYSYASVRLLWLPPPFP